MIKNIFVAKNRDYMLLLAIFIISVVGRMVALWQSAEIPGIGSMYYPLQVRCLLERGTLGFNDVPLVFWIEAFVAKVAIWLSPAPVEYSIVWACKWVNIILPSLIVLPVFFLAKSVSDNSMKPFYLGVAVALAVLNPSVLVLFVVDFDKNAIGMLFIFLFVYFLWQYTKQKQGRTLAFAALSVLLTLLTHFGCFSALFAFILIFMLVSGAFYFKNLKAWLTKSRLRMISASLVLLVLILLPFAINWFDSKRFIHLAKYLSSPLHLFENSTFLQMIRGQYTMDPPNLFFFVVLNLFSVFSVVSYLKVRKSLTREESLFFLSLVIWYVFLSNPFINSDVFKRLLFISLVPLTGIIVFVFTFRKRRAKLTTAIILSLLLVLTVVTSGVRRTFISKEEYQELKQLKAQIKQPETSIVLAQHRLEFWTAWTLHLKSGQLHALTPAEYPKYTKVFYVVQKSNRYREELPITAIQIHNGQYFELYQIMRQ